MFYFVNTAEISVSACREVSLKGSVKDSTGHRSTEFNCKQRGGWSASLHHLKNNEHSVVITACVVLKSFLLSLTNMHTVNHHHTDNSLNNMDCYTQITWAMITKETAHWTPVGCCVSLWLYQRSDMKADFWSWFLRGEQQRERERARALLSSWW